jgi:adenosylmethionine-8-amino-7-oxononanoate aminotransferase
VAAGLGVQEYLERHDLVEHARTQGDYLRGRLQYLEALACVGDIRGKGLLQTMEFVSDKVTRHPFPTEVRFAEHLFEQLVRQGVLIYPMRGTADGIVGDHIMIAPPFIIKKEEIDWFVQQLETAITYVYEEHCSKVRAGPQPL